MITSINSSQLFDQFIEAEKSVTAKRDILNNLNVYPIPDGDTGTNMTLTLKEVGKELKKYKDPSIKQILETAAEASLMGARGNSGVILSQFLHGFCEKLKHKEEISKLDLSEAFEAGTKEAYASVSNPVEGTILTVMKSASEEFKHRINKDNLISIFKSILNRAQFTLKKTPDMLDKLKEAGVVDAGGAGFVYFLEGFHKALRKNEIYKTSPSDDFSSPQIARTWEESFGVFGTGGLRSFVEFNYKAIKFTYKNFAWIGRQVWQVLKFGWSLATIKKALRLFRNLSHQLKWQNIKRANTRLLRLLQVWQQKPEDEFCYEAIIQNANKSKSEIEKILKPFTNSLIIANVSEITKLHMHTNDIKRVESEISKIGKITESKIDNLHEQHEKFLGKKLAVPSKEQRDTKVLAIVNGDGFEKIYKSFGGVEVINTHDTMNPSVSNIKKIFDSNKDFDFLVLPNNKNVIPAAEKAATSASQNVLVQKTYDIAQGLTTLLNFNKQSNLSQNFEIMQNSLNLVRTFSLARALKDTKVNGADIEKGQYFTINKQGVLSCGKSVNIVLLKTLGMFKDNYVLMTLYYGAGVTKDDIQKLKKTISTKSKYEVQIYNAGQPHYLYIVALE